MGARTRYYITRVQEKELKRVQITFKVKIGWPI